MAIYLGGTGGNTNITLGGAWNGGGPGQAGNIWANPFYDATGLQVVVTFKPDNPFAGGFPGQNYYPIFVNRSDNSAAQVWELFHGPTGDLILRVCDSDSGGANSRQFMSASGVIVAGQWHRIGARWRGSDQTVNGAQLWVNGVQLSLTFLDQFESVPAHHPITNLTSNAGQVGGPLAIGGVDAFDWPPSAGAYAEAACWNVYGPDSDMVLYSQGYTPAMMSVPGRVAYVSCQLFTNLQADHFYGDGTPQHAYIQDDWSGFMYGHTRITYNFGGGDYQGPDKGVFGNNDLAIVPHPVIQTQFGMLPDADLLPQKEFQTFERMGKGHIGKRSANVITVAGGAAATATQLQTALDAVTGWGDTVLLDAAAHVTLGTPSTLLFPDTSGWTVDDSTPRMPPHAQRFELTGIRARTGMAARSAMRAKRPQGEPSYVLITGTRTDELRPVTFRHIPLPDGTVVHACHEDSRVAMTDAALMPIIQASPAANTIFQSVTFRRLQRVYWDGIQFLASAYATNDSSTFFDIRGIESAYTWHDDPTARNSPDHIVWNRCLFVCDPLGIGTSCSGLISADLNDFGMFNCLAENWWAA